MKMPSLRQPTFSKSSLVTILRARTGATWQLVQKGGSVSLIIHTTARNMVTRGNIWKKSGGGNSVLPPSSGYPEHSPSPITIHPAEQNDLSSRKKQPFLMCRLANFNSPPLHWPVSHCHQKASYTLVLTRLVFLLWQSCTLALKPVWNKFFCSICFMSIY